MRGVFCTFFLYVFYVHFFFINTLIVFFYTIILFLFLYKNKIIVQKKNTIIGYNEKITENTYKKKHTKHAHTPTPHTKVRPKTPAGDRETDPQQCLAFRSSPHTTKFSHDTTFNCRKALPCFMLLTFIQSFHKLIKLKQLLTAQRNEIWAAKELRDGFKTPRVVCYQYKTGVPATCC